MHLGNLQAEAQRGSRPRPLTTQDPSPGLSPIRVPSMRRSGRSFAHSPKRCEQGSRDTKRAPGTPCHVPTASQPTSQVSAMHGLQHDYKHQKLLATPGPSTTRLIGRAGSYFRAQHVVVSSLGLHTRNSVPKDGSNETTRHVLLYSLSPVPLPNQVQHTTFTYRTHSHNSVHLPDDRPYTTLSIACIAG